MRGAAELGVRSVPGGRRGRAARAIAIAVAAASLVLTGCAAIPSNGTVHEGGVISDDSDGRGVTFTASGPRAGATPDEIVKGFLAAAVDPSTNYEVAREYLATGVRDSWSPDAEVYLRTTPLPDQPCEATSTGATSTSCSYSFTPSAQVDARGTYTAVDPTPVDRSIALVQQKGEWRISQVDNGIVLSSDLFTAVFAQYPLYFFDPTYRYLVPDVRWFPRSSLAATRVATALVTGQADWLQKAVATAFPSGTKANPVSIESGTATVDLTGLPADITAQQKAQIKQQLTASLSAVPTVTQVQLTTNGAPLLVDDGAATTAIPPNVGTLPLVLADDRFGAVSSSGVTTIGGPGTTIAGLHPTAIAYGIRTGTAAVLVKGSGVHRITRDGVDTVVDQRADLIEPSLDPEGYVWSATSAQNGRIRVISEDGKQDRYLSTSFDGVRIRAMEVSRDGTRLLLVLEGAGGSSSVQVLGIIRSDSMPTRLGTAQTLDSPSTVPTDATWVDDTSVATLTDSGAGADVTQYTVGGPSTERGEATGGATIAGGQDIDGLRVLTQDGDLLRLRSSSWQQTNLQADVLATQLPG